VAKQTCKKCGRKLKSDVEKEFNTCTKCLTFKGSFAKWGSLTDSQKAEYLFVNIKEKC